MDITARAKYIHHSPRKVRIVATAVRDLPLTDALNAMQSMNVKAAKIVADVVQSAVANATHNYQLPVASLRIKTLEVGEGPTMKRVRARSRGMANSIHKRTSHVRVVLTDEPAADKRQAAIRDKRSEGRGSGKTVAKAEAKPSRTNRSKKAETKAEAAEAKEIKE